MAVVLKKPNGTRDRAAMANIEPGEAVGWTAIIGAFGGACGLVGKWLEQRRQARKEASDADLQKRAQEHTHEVGIMAEMRQQVHVAFERVTALEARDDEHHRSINNLYAIIRDKDLLCERLEEQNEILVMENRTLKETIVTMEAQHAEVLAVNNDLRQQIVALTEVAIDQSVHARNGDDA